jgi:putative lipoprotein (rSAM/lipoprotein system)
MRALAIPFLKRYNKFIIILLGILGFASACKPETEADEYGCPYATFRVKGTIKDNTNNQAINNIRITMGYGTAVSDANGNFEVSDVSYPLDTTYQIKLEDVDGVLNGEYSALDTTVSFKNAKYTHGDGGWYSGETSKQVEYKMKPKK